jgi:membrane-associated PAP2 superfamily phosphatase
MPAGERVLKPAFDLTRRDLIATFAGLALIVLWEIQGWDRSVSQLFGNASGFALRDAWFTETVLHSGGRVLAGIVLALLVVDLVRTPTAGPTRAQRGYWLGAIVAALTLVPALKRFSLTSCPWNLVEFGGTAEYVPHWLAGVADGGPGHCFPSGHAVSAFAFFGLYFLWRPHRPRAARLVMAAVLLLGTLYGFGQLARGAHFVSHTMWSAWLAWTICLTAQAFYPAVGTRPLSAAASVRPSV